MQVIRFTSAELAALQLERQVAKQLHEKYMEMLHKEEQGTLRRFEPYLLVNNQSLLANLWNYFWSTYPTTVAILSSSQRDYNSARFIKFLDTATPEEVHTALKNKIDRFPAHEIMGLFV